MTRILIALVVALTAITPIAQASAETFEEGLKAYKRERYSRAFDLFSEAAEAGVAKAQYLLGKMHLDGKGIDADPQTAVMWLERAAANDHRKAALLLGKIYSSGMGVPMDSQKAGGYLLKAAELADENDDEDCE